jgi:hypothetical protein
VQTGKVVAIKKIDVGSTKEVSVTAAAARSCDRRRRVLPLRGQHATCHTQSPPPPRPIIIIIITIIITITITITTTRAST